VRIAVDVSPLSHPATGVGNYIRGTLAGMHEAAAGNHELVAFAPTSLRGPARIREALAGLDVELRTWPLPASHAIRTAWSMAGHPAAERLLGPFDVLHFTDWMYPPQRSGVRATTIHDLVPVRFPEWTTKRTQSMHGRKYANAARTCDVIFVNSAFTAAETAELLGVEPARIRIAPPGVKDVFTAEGPAAGMGAPYILTVATLEPRKNLQALADAHRLLGGDTLLAVAGGEGWGEQPELSDPRVRRLGFVSDEELAGLYRGAAVAVYPSRFEGFGMPIVEAMACGTPVVAFRCGSVPEVMCDGVSGFVVDTVDEAVAATERAVNLPRAGVRAYFDKRFSGQRMAEDYVAIFEAMLQNARRRRGRGGHAALGLAAIDAQAESDGGHIVDGLGGDAGVGIE
jgi:glycosyltransferase involved in cell wall biosynthesis